MTWHTDYLVMHTKERYEIVDITPDVERIVAEWGDKRQPDAVERIHCISLSC